MTTQDQKPTEEKKEPDIIVDVADNEIDSEGQDGDGGSAGRYRDPGTGRFASRPAPEAKEPELSPREKIAEAFARARKEAEAEGEEAEQMPVPKKMWAGMSDEEANEQAGIKAEEEVEPGPKDEAAKEPEAKKPDMPVGMTIVVDGQMFQVDRNDPRWAAPGATEDQARAIAQMYWATQARLNSANQYLDKTKGQEGAPSDQHGAALSLEPEADGTGETKLDPDKIGEIVDKLQLGNRDEATEALADLVKSLTQAVGQPRTQSLEQTVQAALVERDHQNEIDRAISSFEKENADIASNKYLSQVVLDITLDTMKEDMRKLGVTDEYLAPNGRPIPPRMVANMYRNMRLNGLPVKTHAEVLSDSVGKLRQTFNLPRAPKPNEADQVTAQGRLAQKRQMQQQPRSAGVKSTQGQGNRPMTQAEWVQAERKRRMPWLGH